jgi:putative transposase
MDTKLLCGIANVSRSGYYQWRTRADNPGRGAGDYLLVKEIFDKGKGKYGWRTIKMRLERDKHVVMNHKKIIRIKREYGLITKIRRRNPYKAIMKKTAEHRVFPNVLARRFDQMVPNRYFGTDITYLPFNGRFAYLAIVKDIASGEIVAWHVSPYITMELVLTMLGRMRAYPGAYIHSDQGFHFTNPAYIQEVAMRGMLQSMSRKGNCIDNAPVESFFGHFKDDVDYKGCRTFEELCQLVENYIRYYNYERTQWGRMKMTPVEYRDHLLSLVAA